MSYKIEDIQGIGPSFGSKLATANIKSTSDLLQYCCDRKGREEISSKTGVAAAQLLKWANMADLMRISGIGPQFSELLEAAGVDTVKELRNRNATNLAEKMSEINAQRNLAKSSPAVSIVEDWVAQAKKTEPKISH